MRRIRHVPSAELAQAAEITTESRRQARSDLARQRELLQHEQHTVIDPLRDERTRVNHLAVLAQRALRGN